MGTDLHQAEHVPKQPQGFIDPELFAAGYNQLSQRSLDQPLHARRDEYPRFPRAGAKIVRVDLQLLLHFRSVQRRERKPNQFSHHQAGARPGCDTQSESECRYLCPESGIGLGYAVEAGRVEIRSLHLSEFCQRESGRGDFDVERTRNKRDDLLLWSGRSVRAANLVGLHR